MSEVTSIDDPVELDDEILQPGDRLWRAKGTSLKSLVLGTEAETFERRFTTLRMRVQTTNVGGAFVRHESGTAIEKNYFHPNPAEIDEDDHYIVLRCVESGILVPFTPERLKELISKGALEVA